jgi:hypothetical protein
MPPSEPPLTRAAPPAPPEPLAAKLDRARDAQETWAHTPLEERVGCLLQAARDMLVRRGEVMALVEEEIGKVHAEALFNEALGPLDAVKGWASLLRRALARLVEHEGRPAVLYVHPWELDPDQPRISAGSALSRFRHYVNLGRTEERLHALVRRFPFGRLGDLVAALPLGAPRALDRLAA